MLDADWDDGNVAKPRILSHTSTNRLKFINYRRTIICIKSSDESMSLDLRQSRELETEGWTVIIQARTQLDLEDIVDEIKRIIYSPPDNYDIISLNSIDWADNTNKWQCTMLLSAKLAREV